MCHRRTNKESVLSADVGPPETNIIYRSKCNMLCTWIDIFSFIGDASYVFSTLHITTKGQNNQHVLLSEMGVAYVCPLPLTFDPLNI